MKPKIYRIISTDFLTMICFLAPLVILILGIDDKYFGVLSAIFSRGNSKPGEAHEFFFFFSISLAMILIPYAIFRIACFQKWFQEAIIVRGLVTFVPAVKDRGTFKYIYKLNGKEYRSWNLVHRTKTVREIMPGDEVDLVHSCPKTVLSFSEKLIEKILLVGHR